jgi:hypothetical protein
MRGRHKQRPLWVVRVDFCLGPKTTASCGCCPQCGHRRRLEIARAQADEAPALVGIKHLADRAIGSLSLASSDWSGLRALSPLDRVCFCSTNRQPGIWSGVPSAIFLPKFMTMARSQSSSRNWKELASGGESSPNLPMPFPAPQAGASRALCLLRMLRSPSGPARR